MRLVQDYEMPVPAVCPLEQVDISRTQEQVLQHRVVREQQMRWCGSHLSPAEQLIWQPRFARIEQAEGLLSLASAFTGVSDVAAESDMRRGCQHLPEPFELVISQC